MTQINDSDRRYQQWVEALSLPSGEQHPIDVLAAHYLEKFRTAWAQLFNGVGDPGTVIRAAIVSTMRSFAFKQDGKPEPSVDVVLLERELGSYLFYEDLLIGFIAAERRGRESRVAELRAAIARHRSGAGSPGEPDPAELEHHLRAAESHLLNWTSLSRDDFQLDEAGEFLEGRTERGKAALRGD
jgi:hypothetical protein